MLDLAIDSKLRGCDLVKIKVGDLVAGGRLLVGDVEGATTVRVATLV
jgi:hypothetical protein